MASRKIPENHRFFNYRNENPKNKSTGDCVIRAIATATGDDWDTVLDDLVRLAHDTKQMINSPELYEKYLKMRGFVKRKQERHEDGDKYTGREFCAYLEEQECACPVLAHIGTHHMTVFVRDADGYKVNDTWDSSQKCVGVYWIQE